MNRSPLACKTDLVSSSLQVNGAAIRGDYVVERIQVTREVNRLGSAQIVLSDGDPSTENFAISAANTLVPGVPVQIDLGYHQDNGIVFNGIIVKYGVRVRKNGQSQLVLTCTDSAVKLTAGRRSAVYRGMSEPAIWEQLLEAQGLTLTTGGDGDAQDPPPDMVRYYSTDWDFLLTRAEASGQVVLVDDARVAIGAPVLADNGCGLVLTYGESMIAFSAEMDARNQLSSVSASGWDIADQKALSEDSEEEAAGSQVRGYISGKELSNVMHQQAFDLMSAAPLGSADLQAWANAQLRKSRLARLCGTVSFQGNASAVPGKTIELAGLGGRFNGDVYIARVEHTMEQGNWVTEVGFGMAPRWFAASSPDLQAPPASGLLPAAQGLQIGTVLQIDADPAGQVRVRVNLPLLDSDGLGVWARHGTPYATSQGGIFFMPELGDEVAVGFLDNDPRFPVVLGSLYSSKHLFPQQPDAPNTYKGIVTKGGLTILLEDVKKIVTISTPAQQSVVIDDEQKTITITDASQNTVTMSQDGVAMVSQTKLTLTAQDITLSASASLTMSGATSAKLSSDGVVTVQGSEVKVN